MTSYIATNYIRLSRLTILSSTGGIPGFVFVYTGWNFGLVSLYTRARFALASPVPCQDKDITARAELRRHVYQSKHANTRKTFEQQSRYAANVNKIKR